MAFTDEQRKRLGDELDRSRVKSREGAGGRSLDYLSQDDVKRTANEIIGFGEWSYRTLELVHIGNEEVERTRDGEVDEGVRVAYRAHVLVTFTATSACYSDWGYGEDVSYTSTLQPHELAVKEAVSDAFKRSINALGNQFGLQLYHEAAERRQEAAQAKRRQRGGGGGRQQQRQRPERARGAAQLSTVTDADLKRIHAKRNELGITERDMKRIMRFCASMPALTSAKEFPRGMVRDMLGLLDQYHQHTEFASSLLAQFEAETGAEPLPEEAPAA